MCDKDDADFKVSIADSEEVQNEDKSINEQSKIDDLNHIVYSEKTKDNLTQTVESLKVNCNKDIEPTCTKNAFEVLTEVCTDTEMQDTNDVANSNSSCIKDMAKIGTNQDLLSVEKANISSINESEVPTSSMLGAGVKRKMSDDAFSDVNVKVPRTELKENQKKVANINDQLEINNLSHVCCEKIANNLTQSGESSKKDELDNIKKEFDPTCNESSSQKVCSETEMQGAKIDEKSNSLHNETTEKTVTNPVLLSDREIHEEEARNNEHSNSKCDVNDVEILAKVEKCSENEMRPENVNNNSIDNENTVEVFLKPDSCHTQINNVQQSISTCTENTAEVSNEMDDANTSCTDAITDKPPINSKSANMNKTNKVKVEVITNDKLNVPAKSQKKHGKSTVVIQSTKPKKAKTKQTILNQTRTKLLKSRSVFRTPRVKTPTVKTNQDYSKGTQSFTFSKRVPKTEEINEKDDKSICKKAGCGKKQLSCCIKASSSCFEVCGKTSRWYHLSKEEHYCNSCFELFYRERNYACEKMHEWKKAWAQNSRADANFKNIATYIAERQLPFWVQCVHCGHWRALTNEVELSPKIVESYICSMGNLANAVDVRYEDDGCVERRVPLVKYSCSKPNESCVDSALYPHSNWMMLLNYIPFLKNSPAAPFLTGYYPDGVGMSAVDTNNSRELAEFVSTGDDDVIRPADVMKKLKRVKKNVGVHESKKNINLEDQSSMMTSPGGRKRTYKETASPVEGLNPYFQPFYKPHERGKALCMRPDVMELDEAEEFPSYYKDQTVYLAIRNLIISLWTFNPCQILTVEKCCQHLLLRGLTRVRLCSIDAPQILSFAVRKGLINLGAIKRPLSKPGRGSSRRQRGTLPPEYSNQKVIVVGTGPAGLGAARQLHNFGCEVVCLEARDRIGGRVHDDWSLDGVCVGKGAQIINGCVNNPLALISHQLGLQMHALQPRCDLFDGKREGRAKKSRAPSKPVSPQFDKRMDFHFNALLDIIVEWRQAQAQDAIDCSLGEKIQEAHQEWMKQSGLSFSELEERLLSFHIGNLEFACGASLDQVSAFHWDQNEIFSQFSGDHTFVQYGFGALLAALANGLDIKFKSPSRPSQDTGSDLSVFEVTATSVYHSEVTDIVLRDDKVQVKTENGSEFSADRVLVTVPLAVLRSSSIRFEPELPIAKQKAMDRLGCGCIEKIGLQFPNRFWGKKLEGANYFGYVPSQPNRKGFFSVFYDVPYPKCEKSCVLMSVISGEAVEESRRFTDDEVLEIALSILRDIFPEEKVPQPKNYFVTRWRDDPYAQMAYSFIKRGSSGDDYDEVAKEIEGRIFFAGEGSNRHFPQTVTGAYLSGIREASKIACANKTYLMSK